MRQKNLTFTICTLLILFSLSLTTAANTNETCELECKVDIDLVLDTSGSMGQSINGITKLQAVQASSISFLDQLLNASNPEYDNLAGLTIFSNFVLNKNNLTSNKVPIINNIMAMSPATNTNFNESIKMGVDKIVAQGRLGVPGFVLFLSDGVPTTPYFGAPVNTGFDHEDYLSTIDAINHAQTNGVPIMAVGFGSGSDINETLMMDIASSTGGNYYFANSSNGLQQVFDDLLGEVCSQTCTPDPYCGDGNVDPGEQCDDGNNVDGDGCSSTCQIEEITCEDAIAQGLVKIKFKNDNPRLATAWNMDYNQSFNLGIAVYKVFNNSHTSHELFSNITRTVLPRGDRNLPFDYPDCNFEIHGFCGPLIENLTSDHYGNRTLISNYSLSGRYCEDPICGDGFVDPGEECDDGNQNNRDGCSNTCEIENLTCIEAKNAGLLTAGIVGTKATYMNNANQSFDIGLAIYKKVDNNIDNQIFFAGNMTTIPPLSSVMLTVPAPEPLCKYQIDAFCGEILQSLNGTRYGPRLLAARHAGGPDFCSNEECGNGILDQGEECDDGNLIDGDGCSALCLLEFCGDGIVNGNETCDDGNQNNNDSCRNDCTLPMCGDGILDDDEQCDDGNLNDGDGCSSECTIEEFCGDGIVQDPEQCDDGNDNNFDSCRNDCSLPACGDGIKDDNEQCDDGNNVDGDGCSSTCEKEPFCGDGIVQPELGEECEPPNTETCNAECKIIDDPHEFCAQWYCGEPCEKADWGNNEPEKEYPNDCMVIIEHQNGIPIGPKCVPTEETDMCFN
tara:strand:- start:1265 stop:3625 length:2361 start_codon:yes stop_codon:yes gene_type:complete